MGKIAFKHCLLIGFDMARISSWIGNGQNCLSFFNRSPVVFFPLQTKKSYNISHYFTRNLRRRIAKNEKIAIRWHKKRLKTDSRKRNKSFRMAKKIVPDGSSPETGSVMYVLNRGFAHSTHFMSRVVLLLLPIMFIRRLSFLRDSGF